MTATGGTITVEDGNTFGAAADVTATGTGSVVTVDHSGFGNDVALSASGASTLTVTNSTVSHSDTLNATGSSALTVDDGANLAVNDSLSLSGGAVTLDHTALSGHGVLTGNLANVSSVEASGGALDISGLTTATVVATVDANATLIVGTTADPVTFNGTGTLQLDIPQNYSGTVGGFTTGDVIDLKGITFSNE